MRWPLHVVGVAHGGRWVEVSLDRPPQHELARLLCDLSKIDERVVWDLVSGFFREFSPSHRHELLTGLNLSLGNRPVADVLLDPERSALMGQEHLHAILPTAPEQDAGARAPRFVGRHMHLLARASRKGRSVNATQAGPDDTISAPARRGRNRTPRWRA